MLGKLKPYEKYKFFLSYRKIRGDSYAVKYFIWLIFTNCNIFIINSM